MIRLLRSLFRRRPMLRSGDHDTIFRFLEGEYESRFRRLRDEAA